MSNCVFTDYWVVGDAPQLNELYLTIKDLEQRENSLIENGFGKKWLGNLVAALGGDPMKNYCRGEWAYTELTEDHLYFFVESANVEMQETRRFLEDRFPGIKIYFQCVGDGAWYTNDSTFKYSSRYYLDTEEEGEDYYNNLSDLIADVEHITGISDLHTLEDCQHALDCHFDENEDFSFSIGEFEIID